MTAGVLAFVAGVLLLQQQGELPAAAWLWGLPACLALALWGRIVVQSFAFVPSGIAARAPPTHGDPFDAARDRLEELLGGWCQAAFDDASSNTSR